MTRELKSMDEVCAAMTIGQVIDCRPDPLLVPPSLYAACVAAGFDTRGIRVLAPIPVDAKS